jgi:hypothetical protein
MLHGIKLFWCVESMQHISCKSCSSLIPRFKIWAVLCCLAAGCASIEREFRRVTRRETPSDLLQRLRDQSYSAEELGIAMVHTQGQQTIRWKEIISPRSPVILSLLPPESEHATQPRIALRLKKARPVPVAIDTGASLNVFDASLALKHGVKVADPDVFGNVFHGLGGKEFSYYGMFDRVSANGLSIQNLFTILRLPTEGSKVEVNNVLGFTTLAKFSFVTLDFPRNQAVFSLDGQYVPSDAVEAEIPLTIRSLQIIVELRINDEFEVNVLLDSGNDTSVMLTDQMIEALNLKDAVKTGKKGTFLGVGGKIETVSFPLRSIGLGARRFTQVEVTVVPNDFVPCLGSGFLRQFKSTIDFKSQKLWLEH